ncbi:gamma carbonic anhydrase family protein [Leifsonia shinshuensis]|uniref:Gamma carbonic anhydrase family protein n=1 Tax=Leifsonia shinshuensis TaxID=150026 RepID=A0A7G6YCX8_9MICO|nr:gamma carbonic anhydrase family protein [Leifsonia shinshuensis]QNE36343.1 gamma carbonic anhydrase family protein [Leifsonia shinshuensis]
MIAIDPSASVASSAVLTGDVTLGPGARVLAGAVLDGTRGPIALGEDTVVMEHAVLRGRAGHPVTVGDAVLIGPHTNITGARIEDEVFVATGACVFAGAVVGARSELRIHAVLQVNSVLPPDTVVPIGWIAAGDPAQLFPSERHDELWAVQQGLDFPGTMYGVPRGTSMREIMRRVSGAYDPLG